MGGEVEGALFPTHAKRRHMWATRGAGGGKNGKSNSKSEADGKAKAAAWGQRPELEQKLILGLFANLLLCPLTSQSLLYAELGAWLQIVGMTLDFLDDVFRLNFALEATQGALNGLAFLQSNFCQTNHHPTQP